MSYITPQSQGIQVYSDALTVQELKTKEDPNSVVWWNPKTDCIVHRSKIIDNMEHPSDNVIVNLRKHFEAKKLFNQGKIDYEDYVVAGYTQEWEDDAYTFKEQLSQSHDKGEDLLNAAVIRPEHFAALQTSEYNEIIIGIENEQHVLLQTINTINMDRLNERVLLEVKDDQTKLVTRNVGEEGLPTEIGPYQWRTRSIGLQLNGIKAVFAGTMRITAFDIDVMSPFVQIMAGALTTDKQKMIAEIMNTDASIESNAIGTDWDSYDATSGRPDAQAYKDIQTYRRAIAEENKGPARWVASGLDAFEVYNDNSRTLSQNIVYPVNNDSATDDVNFIDRNPPRLPGQSWAVDDLLTANVVWVYSPRAIYFAQGPRRSSSLNNSITGNFGTVNLEYYKAHMVFPELMKKYTSVYT